MNDSRLTRNASRPITSVSWTACVPRSELSTRKISPNCFDHARKNRMIVLHRVRAARTLSMTMLRGSESGCPTTQVSPAIQRRWRGARRHRQASGYTCLLSAPCDSRWGSGGKLACNSKIMGHQRESATKIGRRGIVQYVQYIQLHMSCVSASASYGRRRPEISVIKDQFDAWSARVSDLSLLVCVNLRKGRALTLV